MTNMTVIIDSNATHIELDLAFNYGLEFFFFR